MQVQGLHQLCLLHAEKLLLLHERDADVLIQFVQLFLEERYPGFVQDGLVHKVDIVLH